MRLLAGAGLDPRCSAPSCDRRRACRDWCAMHYKRVLRTGSVDGVRPRHRSGTLSARVLDVLETDGGWLTTAGIELLVPDRTGKQIRYALRNLRRRNLIEVRPRDEIRVEWRAV